MTSSLIPDEKIAELREQLDIVQLIGERVQLRRAGVNFKGLCPFHAERTPSFNVNPSKQIFICFGCGEKGDVFSFFIKLEHKTFIEVVREQARRIGFALPERERSPEEIKAEGDRQKLVRVNEIAAQLFRAILLGKAAGDLGAPGRAYLSERGIDAETADKFRLGYAPDQWDTLANHLIERKVPPGYAETVGLLMKRERGGGHYDRFRGRLMCPILNLQGEVVGFSGRIVAKEAPKESAKYINSPESPIYTKGRLLFGAFQARDAWAKTRRAVLVEGNFDVISMHQQGISEAVCPLGTALTEDQVDTLRRRVESVVLMLDGDGAGKRATVRSGELLIRAGVPTYVVPLDTGDDPDSLIRKLGANAKSELVRRIESAVRAIRYMIDNLPRLSDLDPVEAVEHARTIVPLIQAIPDRAAREMAAHQVETATGVKYAQVLRWTESDVAPNPGAKLAASGQAKSDSLSSAKGNPIQTSQKPPVKTRGFTHEEQLLALFADQPTLYVAIQPTGLVDLVTDQRVKRALEALAVATSPETVVPLLLDLAPELAPLFVAGQFARVSQPEEVLREIVTTLRKQALQREITNVRTQLKQSEQAGTADRLVLAQRVLDLRKKLDSLLADSATIGQTQVQS